MKIELHCHTDRYSGCATNSPAEMMAGYAACGYDVVYLTEHNQFWAADELADLRGMFPQLRIFSGVEINDGQVGHDLLVLGVSDPAYLKLGRSGRWDEVLARAGRDGHLTVLAHPCRFQGGCDLIGAGLRPDAMEYRTCNQDDAAMLRRAEALAEAHGLPLLNAGDAHGLAMIDRSWIETDGPVEDGNDIRSIVRGGMYRNCPGA